MNIVLSEDVMHVSQVSFTLLGTRCDLRNAEINIEQMRKFKYGGSVLTQVGTRWHRDPNPHWKAKNAFQKLRNVQRNRK